MDCSLDARLFGFEDPRYHSLSTLGLDCAADPQHAIPYRAPFLRSNYLKRLTSGVFTTGAMWVHNYVWEILAAPCLMPTLLLLSNTRIKADKFCIALHQC